jgi:hypothetical protein
MARTALLNAVMLDELIIPFTIRLFVVVTLLLLKVMALKIALLVMNAGFDAA